MEKSNDGNKTTPAKPWVPDFTTYTPYIPREPKPKGSGKSPDATDNDLWQRLGITQEEFKTLMALRTSEERRSKFLVFMIGVLLTPISLAGALLGYVRGYKRIMWPKLELPNFYPMRPIIRLAMVLGAVAIWVIVLVVFSIALSWARIDRSSFASFYAYLAVNIVLSAVVFGVFRIWRVGANNAILESGKFGTARFARKEELEKYKQEKGLYIGGGAYRYDKQGHLLTIAGSRSGKFTNLIAPNLLGWGNIDGSYVVIDPKGEIAAVTAKYQSESGQNVVVLNPWGMLPNDLPASAKYNPMDILDLDNPHLVDDCHMLAEMLVPQETGRNKFFSDSARAIIAGFILYIAVSEQDADRSLKTLWKWVRYPQEMWDRKLAEMQNDEGPHADNLLYAATEIDSYTKSGNTWGSILATVMQSTDFLKSPALQLATESGFDPYQLAHNKTTVYVIIPTDKLQSHGRWLRLVTTSMMRAVIRKSGHRVVFMLDEFAALGYLPEIETALAAYAGYNVTVWAILQSLVQLNALYEKNWQVFIGNTAVRHYFGIHNNFDAEYISKAIGSTSNVLVQRNWFGIAKSESNARPLITPDELRIESGESIFAFVDDVAATYFDKNPYYESEELKARAGKNPYL